MEQEGGLAKLAAVNEWQTSGLFDDRERLALEYAEAMTYTDRRVDDELFARVAAAFSAPEIVELTAAVALENFRSKLNPTLGVESQGFCVIPGRANAAGNESTNSST